MNDQTTTTNTTELLSVIEPVKVQVKGTNTIVFFDTKTVLIRTSKPTTDEAVSEVNWRESDYYNEDNLAEFLENDLEEKYQTQKDKYFKTYEPPFVDKPTITATQFNGLTGNDKTQYELSLKFLTEKERDQVKDFVEMIYQSKLRAFERTNRIFSCIDAVFNTEDFLFIENDDDETTADNSFGENLLPPQE